MLPLVHRYMERTSFILECIRIWLNPQLEDVKSHMAVPYIPTLLTQMVEEQRRDSLEVFIDCVHNKYGELPDLDITTFIVPISCGSHWIVYVVGDQ